MSLRQEMKLRIKGKSDEGLYAILGDDSITYTEGEIRIVCEELRRRNLNVPTLSCPDKTTGERYVQCLSSLGEALTAFGIIVKFCVVVFVVFALPFGLYSWMDESGSIPHMATVDVFMEGDWIVGENRVCLGMHDAPPPHEGQITTLTCPETSDASSKPHNVTVKFWGRIVRENSNISQPVLGTMRHWKCRRDADGYTCWALD